MKPKRIQLSRKKGFRLPANTVVVSRPSKWGNPFKILGGPSHPEHLSREDAVRLFRAWMTKPGHVGHDELAACVRRDLKGKDLACWCRLDQKCHADVLLEIANA